MFEQFCAEPDGVDTMAAAIKAYCAAAGLSDPIDQQAVARRVIWAFQDGFLTQNAICGAMLAQDVGTARSHDIPA